MIESPRFKLAGSQASFLVSGGFDEKSLFVELVDAESGQQLLSAGGSGGPQMKRVVWDVESWIGQTVSLRVVDRKTASWGHLTFDDFSTSGELVGD